MTMTLEKVRDGLRTNADDLDRMDVMPMLATHLRNAADAIDAHLTQPAQSVDVVAWRWRDDARPGLPWHTTTDAGVIQQMEATGGYEIEPLTRAIGNAQTVDVERLLADLGHVRVPNTRCLARVAETPPQLRPPGPQDPPIWCCLPEGHGGQHRHNGGGMYPSIPFRDTDEIVMGAQLPDYCEKCRHIWPCDDAKAITSALQEKSNG